MSTLLQRFSVLVLAAAGFSALPGRAAATFAENFDSYVTGSMIAGQGGWASWDNNNAYNSMVVDGGLSAPNRIRITGSSDSIRQFSGYTSGKWVFRAKQFVSSSSVGDTYLILLNRYAHGGPYSWSVQLRCNASTGVIQENRTGSGPSLPLVTNQWKEIRCEIDIDANQVSVYYDNQLLVTQTWKIAGDANAQNALACIDLYSDNAGSLAYYDDIRIDPGGPQLAFGNYHTRIEGAILEVLGSGPDRRVVATSDSLGLTDGVRVHEGVTDGTCVLFDPPDFATTPDGAALEISLNGLPPGEPVLDICSVRLDKSSPKLFVRCIPGRSYQEYTIECYLENELVATSPNGPGGAGPELLQWPYWMESRTKKECRPFHHKAIFVPPGDEHDQGDIWIGLGRMDLPGHGIQLVTLPDGTAALCNLIRLVPAPQPGLARHKGAGYDIKMNKGCRTVTVAGEMRYAFGHAVEVFGDNTIAESSMGYDPRSFSWGASNPSYPAGPGGRFITCPSNGMDAVWEELTAPPSDGDSLTMEAYGMLNGVHHRLGTTQCRHRPAFFDIFTDFSDIGASTMRVVGRRSGSVIFISDDFANGLVGSADRWPRCGGKLGRPTPCYRWWWGTDIPFLHGGSVYVIDELLMLADGPPGTVVDDLDELHFYTQGIPEITFTDFQALEYKRVEITPTLQGCPDPAGQMAHYEVRDADTGEVVQEGDAPVGADGKLIIEVWYKGRCIIHIEIGRYLQKNTDPRVLENLNFFDVFLLAGDADGDNEVSIGDFALLSAAFGSSPGTPTWDPRCDFDCDDEITIGDYALLSSNFGEVGDD